MCNLYSQKKPQTEVRDLAKATVDRAGNSHRFRLSSPTVKPRSYERCHPVSENF